MTTEIKTGLNTTRTIHLVKAALKKDLNNVFAIGDILYDLKCEIANNCPDNKVEAGSESGMADYIASCKRSYANMFKELPFGQAVGDKFIRIANTAYLREIADHKVHSRNLPWGYNNLYELTHSKIVNDDEKREMFVQIFCDGEFEIDWKTKPSVKMTMNDIAILAGLTKEPKTEPNISGVFHWNSGFDCLAPEVKKQVVSFSADDRTKFEEDLSSLLKQYGIIKTNEEIVEEAA